MLELSPKERRQSSAGKQVKIAIGIFAMVGSITLGTTLAANISLNGGGNVEFGQGVAATTACDEDGITVTPFSTFINEAGAGSHKLTSIRISGIDSRPEQCSAKTFRIKAYGDGDEPLNLFNWTEIEEITENVISNENWNFIEVTDNGGDFVWTSGGTDDDDVIDVVNDDLQQTAFTLNLVSLNTTITRTPLAPAIDVEKITIESFDAVYEAGDTGPSGGVIIYAADSRQSWGRYIEVAPQDWNDVDGDDAGVAWCSNPVLDVNNATTAIGFAEENTDRMISPNCSSGIGLKARAYQGGGYSNWSVPTFDEMELISTDWYLIPGIIHEGSSGTNGYWVSNGGTGDGNWVGTVQVVGGGQGGVNKSDPSPYLRPVRYF
jgi:hypothetical protein